MENRIKEQQLYLFADRTSCHELVANQLRLWLHSAAYVFMQAFRRLALESTELERAHSHTIREKLGLPGFVWVDDQFLRSEERLRRQVSSWGLCPQTPEVFRFVLSPIAREEAGDPEVTRRSVRGPGAALRLLFSRALASARAASLLSCRA